MPEFQPKGIAMTDEICRKYRRDGRFFDEILIESFMNSKAAAALDDIYYLKNYRLGWIFDESHWRVVIECICESMLRKRGCKLCEKIVSLRLL